MTALPKGAREPFGKGLLLVVDLELVDRIWRVVPLSDTLEMLASGKLVPRGLEGERPGAPVVHDLTGLDTALRGMGTRKSAALPLGDNLRAKRALKAPWRWLTSIPDQREETRLDDRLLRLAEVTRLPELTAEQILAVSSVVEREMVGAAEVGAAFARWSADPFREKVEAVDPSTAQALLEEAWGDLAPLLSAFALDEEPELIEAVSRSLREVAQLSRFARQRHLQVLPWSRHGWPQFLQERAAARGR